MIVTMIEDFNNIFLLLLFALALLLVRFYLVRIILSPASLVKEFNLDKSSSYLVRVFGTFAGAIFIIGIYIILRPEGPTG